MRTSLLSDRDVQMLRAPANDSMYLSIFNDQVKRLEERVGSDVVQGVINGNTLTKDAFSQLVRAMLHNATMRMLSAGYSGSQSDDGASQVLAELAGLISGFNIAVEKRLPEKYRQMVSIHNIKDDLDYEVYKRLHSKFDGIAP